MTPIRCRSERSHDSANVTARDSYVPAANVTSDVLAHPVMSKRLHAGRFNEVGGSVTERNYT